MSEFYIEYCIPNASATGIDPWLEDLFRNQPTGPYPIHWGYSLGTDSELQLHACINDEEFAILFKLRWNDVILGQ